MTNCFGQSAKPEVFTLDAFIGQVRKYHPVARQADLQAEKAGAELMAARGNFDPFLGFEATDKTFDGKNYYFCNNPELTVPLPVGSLRARQRCCTDGRCFRHRSRGGRLGCGRGAQA